MKSVKDMETKEKVLCQRPALITRLLVKYTYISIYMHNEYYCACACMMSQCPYATLLPLPPPLNGLTLHIINILSQFIGLSAASC